MMCVNGVQPVLPMVKFFLIGFGTIAAIREGTKPPTLNSGSSVEMNCSLHLHTQVFESQRRKLRSWNQPLSRTLTTTS
jgi:hypothetical protein